MWCSMCEDHKQPAAAGPHPQPRGQAEVQPTEHGDSMEKRPLLCFAALLQPPPVLCSSSKQRAFATRSLQPLPFHKRVLESDGSFLAGTTQPDERRVRRSQLEPVLSLCSAFQEKLLLCVSSLNASILTARTPGSHLPGHWVPWGCCTQWGFLLLSLGLPSFSAWVLHQQS